MSRCCDIIAAFMGPTAMSRDRRPEGWQRGSGSWGGTGRSSPGAPELYPARPCTCFHTLFALEMAFLALRIVEFSTEVLQTLHSCLKNVLPEILIHSGGIVPYGSRHAGGAVCRLSRASVADRWPQWPQWPVPLIMVRRPICRISDLKTTSHWAY